MRAYNYSIQDLDYLASLIFNDIKHIELKKREKGKMWDIKFGMA